MSRCVSFMTNPEYEIRLGSQRVIIPSRGQAVSAQGQGVRVKAPDDFVLDAGRAWCRGDGSASARPHPRRAVPAAVAQRAVGTGTIMLVRFASVPAAAPTYPFPDALVTRHVVHSPLAAAQPPLSGPACRQSSATLRAELVGTVRIWVAARGTPPPMRRRHSPTGHAGALTPRHTKNGP